MRNCLRSHKVVASLPLYCPESYDSSPRSCNFEISDLAVFCLATPERLYVEMRLMLIDSHAHLDDPRFDADREAVLQRAWDAGVRKILTIGNGSGPDHMGCGIPFAESHDWIYTSVGIHPHDAAKVEERHYALMEDLAKRKEVIAIGEAGLDYYYDHSPRDTQREVFRRQLKLAAELDLPVIIHTRDADADTEELLQQETPSRGLIHCFTSSDRLADFALSIDFFI